MHTRQSENESLIDYADVFFDHEEKYCSYNMCVEDDFDNTAVPLSEKQKHNETTKIRNDSIYANSCRCLQIKGKQTKNKRQRKNKRQQTTNNKQ